MAETANKNLERIDHHLRFAESEWTRLSVAEAEIDGWEPDEAEAFILERDVAEQRFEDLKETFGKGLMTEKQATRFKRLEAVVAENAPILERLRNS